MKKATALLRWVAAFLFTWVMPGGLPLTILYLAIFRREQLWKSWAQGQMRLQAVLLAAACLTSFLQERTWKRWERWQTRLQLP